MGRSKEDRAALCSVVRGQEAMNLHFNIRNFFLIMVVEQVARRGCGLSILGDIKILDRTLSKLL